MLYRIMADFVVMFHLLFIVFVFFGAFLSFRWPWVAFLHVPAFLWGGLIDLYGWVCPLTPLENDLRARGAGEGYGGSFTENYILPLIYPEQLFGSFPRGGFMAIGLLVLALNAFLYWRLYKRLRL